MSPWGLSRTRRRHEKEHGLTREQEHTLRQIVTAEDCGRLKAHMDLDTFGKLNAAALERRGLIAKDNGLQWCPYRATAGGRAWLRQVELLRRARADGGFPDAKA